MKLSNLSAHLILATLPFLMMSCGEPQDRNAVINPAVEGKLIVLKNVEDITKNNATPTLYSKAAPTTSSAPATTVVGAQTTTQNEASSSGVLSGDSQKIINMVGSADSKAFLTNHINAGGKIGFSIHQDQVRVYALATKEILAKIGSNAAVITIEDIRKSKEDTIAKGTFVKQTGLAVSSATSERYIDVAALEIEKSGVLESEKTDYNETKPLLNIVSNLPLQVSTHILLKQEMEVTRTHIKDLVSSAAPTEKK